MKVVRALGLLALLFLAGSAFADPITYTYTGAAFDPTQSSPGYQATNGTAVSGFVTLSSALGPLAPLSDITSQILSFSFTDGLAADTITTLNAADTFSLGTDASGQVDAWFVDLFGANVELQTFNGLGGPFDVSASPDATTATTYGVSTTAGNWTAPVPEPTTLLLMGSGLLTAGFLTQRKLRH